MAIFISTKRPSSLGLNEDSDINIESLQRTLDIQFDLIKRKMNEMENLIVDSERRSESLISNSERRSESLISNSERSLISLIANKFKFKQKSSDGLYGLFYNPETEEISYYNPQGWDPSVINSSCYPYYDYGYCGNFDLSIGLKNMERVGDLRKAGIKGPSSKRCCPHLDGNVIVLYTYDYPESSENSPSVIENAHYNLVMLKVSILSAYRELYSTVQIRVYTTQKSVMTEKLSGFPCSVHELPQEFISEGGDEPDSSFNPIRFNKIGHARVFLIPQLLSEGYSVLYMDQDVFVYEGYRDKILRFFETTTEPKGYMYERYHTVQELLTGYLWNKLDLDEYEGSSIVVNNGVQFFPQSSFSISIANLVREKYKELTEKYAYCFLFDMVALSIVWKKFDLDGITCDIFSSDEIGIFHYYGLKHNDHEGKLLEIFKKWDNELSQRDPQGCDPHTYSYDSIEEGFLKIVFNGKTYKIGLIEE